MYLHSKPYTMARPRGTPMQFLVYDKDVDGWKIVNPSSEEEYNRLFMTWYHNRDKYLGRSLPGRK